MQLNSRRSSGHWRKCQCKRPHTIFPSIFSSIHTESVQGPYYIVITRKNQVLLRFLPVHAIVNGKQIYHLRRDQPVMITVEENHPKVVITDGYHLTKPVELVYHHLNTYYFKVICVIGDEQLIAGFLLLAVLYLVGFFTGVFFLELISFAPIIWFLVLYYIYRKDFIQITPV